MFEAAHCEDDSDYKSHADSSTSLPTTLAPDQRGLVEIERGTFGLEKHSIRQHSLLALARIVTESVWSFV